MDILIANEAAITRAAKALSDGFLVAFPTETVYGLGANALDVKALQRLYAAKGRPLDHPVIVHLANMDGIEDWASRMPQSARLLGEKLWPGPLTMILPKTARVPDQVTGGQNSVGLRIPSHPVALALLRSFGGGLAAPSANKFGRLSPTSAADAANGFTNEVSIILDGGSCEVGIESTIVDFTGDQPRLLRPGMILPEQIQDIIAPTGDRLQFGGSLSNAHSSMTPANNGNLIANTRAPGGLPSHYAPVTPLLMVPNEDLAMYLEQLLQKGTRVCVLSILQEPCADVLWIVGPSQPQQYAQQLYQSLGRLDREGADLILVESVPCTEPWRGIADRLRRASVKNGDPSLHPNTDVTMS